MTRHMSDIEITPTAAKRRESQPQTAAWHRSLKDGRIEFMCRTPGFHMRVSAPGEQAWEAVDMFERWTGLQVQSDRRPGRAPRVIEGQLTMTELLEDENG